MPPCTSSAWELVSTCPQAITPDGEEASGLEAVGESPWWDSVSEEGAADHDCI